MTFFAKRSGALLAALSATLFMGAAAQASAIPFESNGRTVEVRYGDLDLSKKSGQRELTARVHRAAVKVCPGRTMKDLRACQIAAVDHVREPMAIAIAKAQGGDASRFAEVGKDKVPGAGN